MITGTNGPEKGSGAAAIHSTVLRPKDLRHRPNLRPPICLDPFFLSPSPPLPPRTLFTPFNHLPHTSDCPYIGEERELLDTYPDLAMLRDVVFLFKLMMAPTSDRLPELRRWRPADAALAWSFKGTKADSSGCLTVRLNVSYLQWIVGLRQGLAA